jgi:hypothetical protein
MASFWSDTLVEFLGMLTTDDPADGIFSIVTEVASLITH